MKLLVITPSLGSSAHLETAIASVRRATGAPPLLVVPERARKAVAQSHPGVEIVTDDGTGLYAALNRGLASGGDWEAFTWLNDDDEFTEGFGGAVAQVGAGSTAEVLYGRVDLTDTTGRRVGSLPVAREPRDLPFLLARGIMPLAQPGTLIRRQALDRVGPFDESYGLAGDLDWFVRAIVAGRRFEFCDKCVARFRLRAGQLSKKEQVAVEEFRRATTPLQQYRSGGAGAVFRFRWANKAAYLNRLVRHGPVRMATLYRRQ